MSAFESKLEYKQGSLPDSFTSINGSLYFEIGFEYDEELRKLEGAVHEKLFKTFQIVFVGKSFIAIGNSSAEDRDWVQHFLENNFVKEVVLDPIQFDEKILRNVIESNPDVFQVEHEPSSRGNENVDRLTITGRGVIQSRLYEEHSDEPLRKVKVKLYESSEGVTVSFYKEGRLTILGESTPDRLLPVLNIIVEKVIAPFTMRSSYQRRLV